MRQRIEKCSILSLHNLFGVRMETKIEIAVDAISQAQDELWVVQLQEYPDSVRLTSDDVIGACYNSLPPLLEETLKDWDERDGTYYQDSLERMRARASIKADLVADHRLRVARKAVICLAQDPCGVFYKCGKRDDGSYKYTGFRVGLEPQDYLSNFDLEWAA